MGGARRFAMAIRAEYLYPMFALRHSALVDTPPDVRSLLESGRSCTWTTADHALEKNPAVTTYVVK